MPDLLEVNRLPQKHLRLLLEVEGARRVERALNVHRTTVRRWLDGTVKIPGAQHLAIRYLLGDLPGTMGAWKGWRFQDGELVSPGGDRYTPGDVLATRLQQQRAHFLDQELLAAKIRLVQLEQTVDRLSPAANESDNHALRA